MTRVLFVISAINLIGIKVCSLVSSKRTLDLTLPALDADIRLGAPVRPGKIVGCALTYGKHAAEAAWTARRADVHADRGERHYGLIR